MSRLISFRKRWGRDGSVDLLAVLYVMWLYHYADSLA